MSDFYQHRAVTTLHQLAERDYADMDTELVRHAKSRPITVVMPTLFSEVEGPALPGIVDELASVNFVERVVVSMNKMSAGEFDRARAFFARLPQEHHLIWNDGPRMAEIYRELEAAGMTGYVPGKGCNVWMGCGFALSAGVGAVVTHDSDILTYDRGMLARLCLPVVHPDLGYRYCKSYYGRVSERMNGRVTRLFVIPLVRAMIDVFGRLPLLEFIEGFRYPLSGEFAISAELASRVRMPGGWGLEVGMLAEVHRAAEPDRICQVALGANFEHKHQRLGAEADEKGLGRGLGLMAGEIAASLFSHVRAAGALVDRRSLDAVACAYREMAAGLIARYEHDSLLNGLLFDRAGEADAVGVFEGALLDAGRRFVAGELLGVQLVSWGEALEALPGLGDAVLDAVRADNA